MAVTVDNFVRAESDTYFRKAAGRSGVGVLHHARVPTRVEEQSVVRMNRDTLYSSGVVDVEAGPVTVHLPDSDGRFLSLMPLSQDHYTTGCVYGAGPHTFTRELIGTRYAGIVVRTLVDPENADDVAAVHALQDAIRIDTPVVGAPLEAPNWDQASLGIVRDTLRRMSPALAYLPGASFGTRVEVNPLRHLIGTAGGWGGNPPRDARYMSVFPEQADGSTPYRLTVGDVPVHGFWSISVYNADGYFERNEQHAYSINNLTAVRNDDGTITVQFGGEPGDAPNQLPITPGWNYVVRMYRPHRAVLEGGWTFPRAEVVGGSGPRG